MNVHISSIFFFILFKKIIGIFDNFFIVYDISCISLLSFIFIDINSFTSLCIKKWIEMNMLYTVLHLCVYTINMLYFIFISINSFTPLYKYMHKIKNYYLYNYLDICVGMYIEIEITITYTYHL